MFFLLLSSGSNLFKVTNKRAQKQKKGKFFMFFCFCRAVLFCYVVKKE